MKKLTRIIGIVLAISIGTTLITACSGNVETEPESTSSQMELVE